MAEHVDGLAWVSVGGYLKIYAPWHDLADRVGNVLVHRAVLYDKIGPGVHPCEHCGGTVEWGMTLETDHLNWFVQDNRPANLVPSCGPCNRKRKQLR